MRIKIYTNLNIYSVKQVDKINDPSLYLVDMAMDFFIYCGLHIFGRTEGRISDRVFALIINERKTYKLLTFLFT